MKHKTNTAKRMAAAALSACMLCSVTVAVLPAVSLTAFAGEELGNNTFENQLVRPWQLMENGAAMLKGSIVDGAYQVQIVNPGGAARGGESRWDAQFRHRQLILEEGHEYHVQAEVTADHDGEIYTKIGDTNAPYDEIWHNGYALNEGGSDEWKCMPVKAGETLKIDSTFISGKDCFYAEWAWQFGGAGETQETDCFPGGTTLTFDNLYLTDLTDDQTDWTWRKEPKKEAIQVNQIGYFTNLRKQATFGYSMSIDEPQPFSILRNAREVYQGTTIPMGFDEDSGEYVHLIDFSAFCTPGEYTLQCGANGFYGNSLPFRIGDDIYDGVMTNAVNYFYQNRSGMDISADFITSQGKNETKEALERAGGHDPETALIQSKWQKSYSADGTDVEDGNGTLDEKGGWYDGAGNTKWVTQGGISVWTLQNLYERTLKKNGAEKFQDGSGVVVVPETDNKIPDLLDEAKYELDWMFKMLVPGDYSMTYDIGEGKDTGKYENMVFSKVSDHYNVSPLVSIYDPLKIKRVISPPTTEATLQVAAVAAQAARLFRPYDADYADLCLKNAERCFAAAQANPALYTMPAVMATFSPDAAFKTEDEFYWAACELFATTRDSKYLTLLTAYENALTLPTSLEPQTMQGALDSYGPTFASFDMERTAGLGTLSLFLNQDGLSKTQTKQLSDSLLKAADTYIAKENEQGYGLPYQASTMIDRLSDDEPTTITSYEYGSNGIVTNNAIVMAYAYDLTKDVTYLNGVLSAADYLFGRNTTGHSYVTGYGDSKWSVNAPHHRFWLHALASDLPSAPNGVLVNGPTAWVLKDQDAYDSGLTVETTAPQACYSDNAETWSCNSANLEFNAPFVWMMSFLEDEAASCDYKQPVTLPLYGDINNDTIISITDAVLLARFVAQDDDIHLSQAGVKNADVDGDAEITSLDVSQICRFLAGLTAIDAPRTTTS